MCRLFFILSGMVQSEKLASVDRIMADRVGRTGAEWLENWTMKKLVDMTKRIPVSRFVFFWFCLVILVGLLISLTLSKKDEMKLFNFCSMKIFQIQKRVELWSDVLFSGTNRNLSISDPLGLRAAQGLQAVHVFSGPWIPVGNKAKAFISNKIPCKESSSTYFKSTEFREEQTITYDNYVWRAHSIWLM